MQIVYAHEKAPQTITKSIFLAGPTPRSQSISSWRPEALEILACEGYDGVVFVPEPRGGEREKDYIKQVEWEEKHLNMADCILFWIPRELKSMPALTTNTEFGVWQDSGKVVFGAPLEAEKVRYQHYYAAKLGVPISNSLQDTVCEALIFLKDGAKRIDGEREVPLHIWNTPCFQQWYGAQKTVGNRMDGAKVVWTFRVGLGRKFVFFWALHVNIHIVAENRNKTNEVVLSRPDISTVMMYQKATNLKDSIVVLIREFRSPAATCDGFVWEIPGGSSFKPGGNPLELAAAECGEETGLCIEPVRVKYHACRQLVSTLSSHKAHVFSVEITPEELDFLRKQKGIAHGVIEDTERTYVEVKKLGEIMEEEKVDWSMLGMILSVLQGA
jgi:8-oxo-dGTP pyrophosphatase MutT (NUDIX family)